MWYIINEWSGNLFMLVDMMIWYDVGLTCKVCKVISLRCDELTFWYGYGNRVKC